MTPVVRVMLVEDHTVFREMLALVIGREPGFEVVVQAGSLAGACRELEELGKGGVDLAIVDLAIVDLRLPDGDGTELIGEFCGENAHCAVLVLTADAELAVHGRAVEKGASGVLHKSVGMGKVMEAVRRLAAGEALHSQREVVELLRLADRRRTQGREARAAFEQLTLREKDALQALAEGMGDKEIAARLGVSSGTARGYVSSILQKLGVNSRLQALVFAARHGLVDLGPGPAERFP